MLLWVLPFYLVCTGGYAFLFGCSLFSILNSVSCFKNGFKKIF